MNEPWSFQSRNSGCSHGLPLYCALPPSVEQMPAITPFLVLEMPEQKVWAACNIPNGDRTQVVLDARVFEEPFGTTYLAKALHRRRGDVADCSLLIGTISLHRRGGQQWH